MDLNQITISVSDVSRSITFYSLLGLKLIVKALPHYARFECPAGNSTFSLHHVPGFQEDTSTTIYFEVADLEMTVSELQQKEVVFSSLPEMKPWLWKEAHLRDPDGHRLIIFHAGKNRKDPPWKIKA